MKNKQKILLIGYSFSLQPLVNKLAFGKNYQIIATTRDATKFAEYIKIGLIPVLFGGEDMVKHIKSCDAIFVSLAPNEISDGFIIEYGKYIRAGCYLGYLSTTGVYGDKNGDWVDEQTLVNPKNTRSIARLRIESYYQQKGGHIFRLSGIYGDGRNCLLRLLNGTERRIFKAGQYFSRIHHEDISQICLASLMNPHPSTIYNCADDEPTPPHIVVEFGASLLKMPPPKLENFDNAELSPMAKSFYLDNKRVKNDKIKTELGVKLIHPNYRIGLQNIFNKLSLV